MGLGPKGRGRVSSEGHSRGKEGRGAWVGMANGDKVWKEDSVRGWGEAEVMEGPCCVVLSLVSTQRVTRGTEGFEKVHWPQFEEEHMKRGGGKTILAASQ